MEGNRVKVLKKNGKQSKLQREKTNNNSKGQILAEFVISVGILSIGLVSSLVCINSALQVTNRATELQAAVYLAIEEMELVKNIQYPYPDDPANSDQFDNITARSLTDINRCDYTFDLQRTVTPITDSAGNRIKTEVQVEISKSGSSQALVSHSTYIFKDGL